MKIWIPALMLILCGAFALAACGGDGDDAGAKKTPRKKAGAEPILRQQPPPEYEMKELPDGMDLSDPELIAKGREIYVDVQSGNCASCHGDTGKGDGPVMNNPPAGDLTSDEFHDSVTDQYIFWRIKTGGIGYAGRLQSAMMGFMQGSDEEIWALVAYVRSLHGK